MESSINQRFAEIVRFSGKSINQCAKDLGVSQPTLRACVNGENKPSFDVVEKISIVFPMISAEWLLRGNGDMIIKEETSSSNDVSKLIDIISSQQKLIESLQNEKRKAVALEEDRADFAAASGSDVG